eukprot:TRINITY_DN1358_c0_g1_i3.p1 TRINITY_DN1358_c0_g1~~TRINITY_DN1358_c0_g1_i3.p1  ORF type:complete len:374 (-),score=100.72 TRINITY_DN1358_c0_g1_i3:559-1680(-)
MKHIAIVVLCIMFAITTTSALLSQNDVKTHFDKFFVDKELTKAGATGVMVVVTEGQNLVWQGSYGQKKMTFDSSLIPIADLSATITASTVMQLVQDNKIDLQKDVNEYLKKDAELATLVTDFIIGNYSNYGNSPVFPTTEKITTHNLLTQTAGLDARQIGLLANTFETIMDPLTAIKTVFPPRIRKANEICQFSHHGITLAGVIAQLVSGTKLDKLVQDKIFTPLKMESSSPFLTDKIVANANFAKPSKTVAGTLVETFATPFNNYWPSNGIVSTAKDMSWFMRANLNNGTIPSILPVPSSLSIPLTTPSSLSLSLRVLHIPLHTPLSPLSHLLPRFQNCKQRHYLQRGHSFHDAIPSVYPKSSTRRHRLPLG